MLNMQPTPSRHHALRWSSCHPTAALAGTHPHDHGHRLIADVLTPVIGGILGLPGFARQQPMSLAQLQAVTTRSAARMRAAPAAISADAMPPASPPLSYSQQGASSNGAAAGQTWVPVTALTMWGHAFNNTPTPFNRLPAAAEGVVRAAVWSLSLNSAGLLVSFLSSSSSFAVNYTAQESFQPVRDGSNLCKSVHARCCLSYPDHFHLLSLHPLPV